MAMKEFKAESKKLMDMMINSIYTNKEIFLRELISNASDAIDKLYYTSLTDTSVGLNKDDFRILLTLDKENRLLTLSDNGIGMSREDLEENLGTIAHSGSLNFKKENQDENIDIIGQFGVGFYSSFMVADEVTVISRAYGSSEAWKWSSHGVDGYTIEPADKDDVGTDIYLHIKPNTETDNYDQFVEEYSLVAIVKKYSDYVRYPINMFRQKSRMKAKPEDAGEDYTPEYESYTELETLNSMVPIWKKAKSEVTEEEYAEFYKSKFYDYTDPARVIVSRTEGSANYNALLFVPARQPYDYYTKEYEKGLALYASGVLIMEKCADLLPDHFGFMKGIVDSQDLSLNISREMLQQDHQLKRIRTALEKKIKNELLAMLRTDREKYEGFWNAFGRQLKFGAYSEYGMHAELLRDLLLFYSAKQQKLVTLEEYVEAMPAEQKCIYFAAGENTDRLAKLPAAQLVLDKGYDLLLLTEDVDEFCLQVMNSYPRKDAEGKDGTVEFKNVNSGDLGLESDEEKKAAEEATAENQSLFDAMKLALGDAVAAIKVSTRLKDHPVCLSAEGPLSIEMEKVLASQPGAEGVKSRKVLELNAAHPVFEALKAAQSAGDEEKLASYSRILLAQAQLIEGLPVDDPVAYAQAVCSLMK
ncbi:MAG: molecular chaperone HtpG [Faecalibacterium sp.]|nr:molecular chaperone HtpG [Faecalibacterium sp.]